MNWWPWSYKKRCAELKKQLEVAELAIEAIAAEANTYMRQTSALILMYTQEEGEKIELAISSPVSLSREV